MPSPMQVLAFVMVTYFMVTGGVIYDVINEPPSVGQNSIFFYKTTSAKLTFLVEKYLNFVTNDKIYVFVKRCAFYVLTTFTRLDRANH